MATRTAYTALIQQAAAHYGVDPTLLEALVLVESAGHADAFRFEPQYALRYHVAERFPQWPVRAVAASYGLCQIMYPTALALGYDPTIEPEQLFVPVTNLHYGAAQLRRCVDWAAGFGQSEALTLQAALCGYNGGCNSHTSPLNPRPSNIGYAVRVLNTARSLVQ